MTCLEVLRATRSLQYVSSENRAFSIRETRSSRATPGTRRIIGQKETQCVSVHGSAGLSQPPLVFARQKTHLGTTVTHARPSSLRAAVRPRKKGTGGRSMAGKNEGPDGGRVQGAQRVQRVAVGWTVEGILRDVYPLQLAYTEPTKDNVQFAVDHVVH
jgi:hypothetical protein